MSENSEHQIDPRLGRIVEEENDLLNRTIQQVQMQHLNQRLIESRIRILDLEAELDSLRKQSESSPVETETFEE